MRPDIKFDVRIEIKTLKYCGIYVDRNGTLRDVSDRDSLEMHIS